MRICIGMESMYLSFKMVMGYSTAYVLIGIAVC
jgi:hypothetical protein